jgi:hypothetical protein
MERGQRAGSPEEIARPEFCRTEAYAVGILPLLHGELVQAVVICFPSALSLIQW